MTSSKVKQAIKREPDVFGVHFGTIDLGPYYIGASVPYYSKDAIKRDLVNVLVPSVKNNIPVVFSGTGCFTRDCHKLFCKLLNEVARENHLRFTTAIIRSELDKEYLKEKLTQGKITVLDWEKKIQEEDIERSKTVAMMGEEPIIEALNRGVDVVSCARAYDASTFAAFAVKEGFDRGLALHMGKIIECGVDCTENPEFGTCIIGIMGHNYFILDPADPKIFCTPRSVAAHSLYERTNPYFVPGPGGVLDTTETKFEQMADMRRVKVSGSKFLKDEKYRVKLEGVALEGYRSVCFGGIIDRIVIEHIDELVNRVKTRTAKAYPGMGRHYHLNIYLYGKNACMANLGPKKEIVSPELGVVVDVVAKTQMIADQVCGLTRRSLTHIEFPGFKGGGTNIAWPVSPFVWRWAPYYAWTIHHLLELEDPCECFPIDILEFPGE